MSKKEPLTYHEIKRTVDSWRENGNSITAAAKALGIHRRTVGRRLDKAMEMGLVEEGRQPVSHSGTKVYVLTSAQDDTPLFKNFWTNLLAYVEHRKAELLVGGYTYSKNMFKAEENTETATYDTRLGPYMCTEKKMLAPGLMWVGDANILPTAVNPLSGYENLSRDNWAIIPHSRIRLQSVPISPSSLPKQIMSTGTVTDPNYIQRSAGKKAEFHHTPGAVVVEVASNGTFWCRHINATSDGSFYDLTTFIQHGSITHDHRVEAVNWGDIHKEQLDIDIEYINWGREDSIIDVLKPKYQFMHDLLDFYVRNHHNRDDPHFLAKADMQWGTNGVQKEIAESSNWLEWSRRDFCQTVVVESNHDQALGRWIKDAKVAQDHMNARYWHELNAAVYRSIEAGEQLNTFEYACREESPTHLDGISFVTGENSFLICQGVQSPIECALHGHKGTNGSRGSAVQFSKAARKYNVGHAHSPAIIEGTFQAGVSGKLNMGYNAEGLSSWDHSHIVTYPNGKRTLITIRDGKWRG